MNKRQKEVLQASLTDEQAVLDALERNYTAALADVKRSIKALQANPLTQSRAYQLEYQQALERQISGALDVLQSQNFTTVAEYLQAAYTTSFVGSMYDMHGQGVPLLLPIDEATVLATVQKTGDDFKLSRKLGGDTDLLKRQVQDEITRGLASGSSYAKIARSITDYGEADYKRSARIARTEGHRVQNEARMHSMERAKKAGADVVKQWDATLDDTTRESHAKADGEIREMDEKFSNGLMFPGDPDGKAAEVVNCRCAMLVRARWALDEGELKTLQERAEFFGLDKTENFEDFKEKYLKSTADSGTMQLRIESPIERRNTAAGRPNAVAQFADVPLNKRQQKILGNLPQTGSRVVVKKSDVSMKDLSALTAQTGDEFAMFTKGGKRLVVRGDSMRVNLDADTVSELIGQGYRWSGHTHPGFTTGCLQASDGDIEALTAFGQTMGVIYNSKGEFQIFSK